MYIHMFKFGMFIDYFEFIYRKIFVNPKTNALFKEGETIKMTHLGQTLKTIATEGPSAFYNGNLTKDILEEFKDASKIKIHGLN